LNNGLTNLRSLEFLLADVPKAVLVRIEEVGEAFDLAPAQGRNRNARALPRGDVAHADVIADRPLLDHNERGVVERDDPGDDLESNRRMG
jgi:hypothetical protein